MERTTRCVARLAAVVLCLAAGAQAMAGESAEGVASGDRQAVLLKVTIDGQDWNLTAALDGEPVRIDRSGISLQLVPALQPTSKEGDLRLVIETYEVLEVNGSEQRNLVEAVPLPSPGDGAATIFASRSPIQIEAIGTRQLPASSRGAGPGQDLRPIYCCVACGTVLICADCVETDCGVCCRF